LSFKDSSFDAVTAILTIHHWSDIEQGLKEAVRVAKKRLVLLTWIGFVEEFWLVDYLPEINEIDNPMFPSIDDLTRLLGQVRVVTVPIPHDCTDGFLCAYWQRPQAYLDEDIRRAISTFSRVTDVADGLQALEKDLNSGIWYQRYGSLLSREQMDFGYRIVIYEK
jgi:SAM-dependent methyltransferase